MHHEAMGFDNLLSKIERLEKENRRVKQIMTSGLLILCCAFFMGQSRPGRTIEAERFIVKDSSGKTRGEFGVDHSDAGGATLTVGSLVAGGRGTSGEKYLVTLHGGDYAWINLRAADSREYINGRLNNETDDGALFSVTDGKDYETDIGNTDLLSPRTGEKHSTSAASVVLFGKDKTVLWSAP
jgi:hypothetical protein